MTKKPKVVLVNHTYDPILLMSYFRRIMHSPVPDSLIDLFVDPRKWLGTDTVDDYFDDMLLMDGMPTFLESVNFIFKIENVSRAFTHQIVRHRIGFSFSQQSQRCVRCESFADDGKVLIPDTVKNKEKYLQRMKNIQKEYNGALEDGESTQDARGLLPTNIQTSIIVSGTLRAWIGLINKRMCMKVQGEFVDVAKQMRNAIVSVEKKLDIYFGPPCRNGKCMMESENRMQFKEGKLDGEQNTSRVCSNFLKLIRYNKKG